MTTVIISERDEFTRLGLKSALQTNEDIGILGDYETDDIMLSDLGGLNPDVVILGGTNDILNRCQTCREVRTLCPTAKVLTLSDKQNDDDLYEIILSGASGDVLKSAGSSEMVRSLSIVACGGLNYDSDALVRLLGRNPNQRRVASPPGLDLLGERETTILSMIATGYKNSDIAQVLNVSPSTVRADITRIREKLNIDSRTELAAYAVRHGVIQEALDGQHTPNSHTDT